MWEKTPPPADAGAAFGPFQTAAAPDDLTNGKGLSGEPWASLGEDALRRVLHAEMARLLAEAPTVSVPANEPLLQKLASVKVLGWAVWILVLVACAATRTIPAWAGYAGSVSTVGLLVSRALVEYGVNVNNPPPGTMNVPVPAQ